MKNVTITLDEDVAQWARVFAAKNNTSVSPGCGAKFALQSETTCMIEPAFVDTNFFVYRRDRADEAKNDKGL